MEPNRYIFAIPTRTAGKLPGPVANTSYEYSIPTLTLYSTIGRSLQIKSRKQHYILQGTVAALPPFGGTEIDYLQLNSQEYLTPGCQVLGGYEKLDTLADMISSPGSDFAVLEHV